MFKNIAKITIATILSLSFAVAAHAATSIQLEQPASPTNQSSFNINFVTLDTQNNNVTVKCFKKGPSDGAFTQFGADIAIALSGGNTGNCSVDSGVLNTSGTYQFYAMANGTTSNIVSVDFNNTTGPGTPTNYSKEKPSDCIYRIKFKTADDSGKTVKVEVYRSENTSFSADSGTRVSTVSITSNTDGQTDVSSPDCSKSYYFVVRAFDSFGNGSSTVGDSGTTTTNTTTTTTTTNTTNSPSSTNKTNQGAIPISSTQSQVKSSSGSVLGDKTGEEGQVEATSTSMTDTSPSPSPQTGVPEKPTKLFSALNIGLGIGVLVILMGVYFFVIHNKPDQV
ncbi:MAG TPA: hypothetical protein VLE91_00940 [Candidatus Saccharimonadales bacterium]|nr:hypothetical protein [Candidatus Saccharimonadales bacterium]